MDNFLVARIMNMLRCFILEQGFIAVLMATQCLLKKGGSIPISFPSHFAEQKELKEGSNIFDFFFGKSG